MQPGSCLRCLLLERKQKSHIHALSTSRPSICFHIAHGAWAWGRLRGSFWNSRFGVDFGLRDASWEDALGSDLCNKRESDGAWEAMHVPKAWQEHSQRSIKLFSWALSFQLLTGGRPVVQFSSVGGQWGRGRAVVAVLTDLPFHGILYKLQNLQGQSFELVLVLLLQLHLQLGDTKREGWCYIIQVSITTPVETSWTTCAKVGERYINFNIIQRLPIEKI